jgi:arginine/lysine/ornithine decarboxylase
MSDLNADKALYDKLREYAAGGIVPMHVPGHKRNTEMLGDMLPYGIDITELPGFDNLHDMRGVLAETAELAAELYGCERAFPLVNGSTGGLLAAVRAMAPRGGSVVMARNCHMSVYSAVELCGLTAVYVTPETDARSGLYCSVAPEAVEAAVRGNPGCALVVITSPTYEGVVSDVASIAEIAHSRGIPLLVDEAHGAHFGFSEYFPPEAARAGADAAILSLHKTLPALTQCALALVGGPLCDGGALERELAVFQTSSPSYVLLASIDRCVRLMRERGKELLVDFSRRLERFDARIAGLGRLRVVCHGSDAPGEHAGFYGFDPGKLVVLTRDLGVTGAELAETLRSRYKIETELAAEEYVVAVATLCDTDADLGALADALVSIDSGAGPELRRPRRSDAPPEYAAAPDGDLVPLADAEGAVALEHVWAYPPGIPIIAAGETVSREAISSIRKLAAEGTALKSQCGGMPRAIRVRR